MPDTVYLARRRSLVGPILLIVLGVLFLLGNLHVLPWVVLGHWFARYWPLLLVVVGVVRLIEYYHAKNAGYVAGGVGAGTVVMVILLVIFGMSATTSERVNWGALRGEMGIDDDFSGFFGQTYSFDDELQQDFPAGASLHVVSDRGDVTVNSWAENKIKIVVHKRVVAGPGSGQDDAQKINTATRPEISVSGNVVNVNANTSGGGNHAVQSDMEIFVPKNAALEISTRRGDVVARERVGDARVSTSRGDITIDELKGNADVQIRRGSLRATKITGDLRLDGSRVHGANIADIGGHVGLSGEFTEGSIMLARVAKGVSFKSHRTDMELARLDGDLTMDLGDMRASQITGPFRINTRSKDIHLDGISGDVKIENSNGAVEIHAASPMGHTEINTHKGDVQLVLPGNAAFQLDAHAHRGDVESAFKEVNVQSEHDNQHATGQIGSGGPRVQIQSNYGNIAIRKAG